MADLSSYVDFTVLLDKSGVTPVITLQDTSDYPDDAVVTGVFAVVQPDKISVAGAWSSPDITIASNTSCNKALRLASDDTLQQGDYTVIYTARAAGYDDTTKIKTFTLDYTPVKQTVTNLTNPFTPSVQAIDATTYAIPKFNAPTITRAWTGNIQYVGNGVQSLSGTAALLDCAYSAQYYDAHYLLTLASTVVYVSSAYAYLTVKDKFTTTFSIDAYTPPTLAQLRDALNSMKAAIEAGTHCSCGCGGDKAFSEAEALYNLLVQNGQNGQDTFNLYNTALQLQKKITCSGIVPQVHTNTAIPAYDWGSVPSSGGGGGNLPIQFKVGAVGAPADGTSDYSNASKLANKTAYAVYSASDARFLTTAEIAYNLSGGFSWTNGRTFVTDEEYTILY